MTVGGPLLTHAIAHRKNKPPFFFSRFNFQRMRERGNTHYCFYCLSRVGFRMGPNGEISDHLEGGHNGMKNHNAVTHANGIIGDADKFDSPWKWLEAKIGKDFPFVVSIPQV